MILLVNVIIQVNIYTHTHIYIWIWTTQAHWCMDLSGECVISLVLSHHRKIWSNGQTSVIAQFHLESKGKYILEAWGWVDPKDKRGLQLNFGSSFYVFFLPPPLPPESALCKLGRLGGQGWWETKHIKRGAKIELEASLVFWVDPPSCLKDVFSFAF